MAFLGYARGHRINPETRCCMQQHTKCLMSAWILSLEPEHRQNQWTTTEVCKTWEITWGSVQCSSCLRLQLFSVETFLLFPKC
jgi:hypothetical protein